MIEPAVNQLIDKLQKGQESVVRMETDLLLDMRYTRNHYSSFCCCCCCCGLFNNYYCCSCLKLQSIENENAPYMYNTCS